MIRTFFFEAINQHIRMISEGSCDTEDWSNDAENSCHSMNKIHFKNENIPFLMIFHNVTALLYFIK